MLLLLDLDNTLVDRSLAFGSWAASFVESLGRSPLDAMWLIAADDDGYESRNTLAHAIKERFALNVTVEQLVGKLLYEHVDAMTIQAGTAEALMRAKDFGWRIAIVTNGTTSQQNLKIQQTGLEPLVDAVVISEAEQVGKPDPKIFQIAARRLGVDTAGGWMIGDHPVADIAGGQAAGLQTGWVSRNRDWPRNMVAPTLIGSFAAEIIETVISGGINTS